MGGRLLKVMEPQDVELERAPPPDFLCAVKNYNWAGKRALGTTLLALWKGAAPREP